MRVVEKAYGTRLRILLIFFSTSMTGGMAELVEPFVRATEEEHLRDLKYQYTFDLVDGSNAGAGYIHLPKAQHKIRLGLATR